MPKEGGMGDLGQWENQEMEGGSPLDEFGVYS